PSERGNAAIATHACPSAPPPPSADGHAVPTAVEEVTVRFLYGARAGAEACRGLGLFRKSPLCGTYSRRAADARTDGLHGTTAGHARLPYRRTGVARAGAGCGTRSRGSLA